MAGVGCLHRLEPYPADRRHSSTGRARRRPRGHSVRPPLPRLPNRSGPCPHRRDGERARCWVLSAAGEGVGPTPRSASQTMRSGGSTPSEHVDTWSCTRPGKSPLPWARRSAPRRFRLTSGRPRPRWCTRTREDAWASGAEDVVTILRTSQPTHSVSVARSSWLGEAVRAANLSNSTRARTRASLRLMRVTQVGLAVLIGGAESRTAWTRQRSWVVVVEPRRAGGLPRRRSWVRCSDRCLPIGHSLTVCPCGSMCVV